MAIGLEAFRSAQGDRLTIEKTSGQATGVKGHMTAPLKFWDRVVQFFKPTPPQAPSEQEQMANREFNTTFRIALVKAEGREVARKAMKAGGLDITWDALCKPVSAKQVKLVLDKAQHYRKAAVKENEANIKAFLKGNPSAFATAFANANNGRLPESDANNAQLHKIFRREVKRDSNYTNKTLTAQDLQVCAERAIAKFHAQKEAAFRETHPGLARFAGQNPGMPRLDHRNFCIDLTAKLVPLTAEDHQLAGEQAEFRSVARNVLTQLDATRNLLSTMKYDPEGWQGLLNDISAQHDRLTALEADIAALADDHAPQTQVGQHLLAALTTELSHQKELLLAKFGFVQDVRRSDPLSEKMVAYSDLLWAQAAGKIFDQAMTYINENPKSEAEDSRAIRALQAARKAYINERKDAYSDATLQRIKGPTFWQKHWHGIEHPALVGKTHTAQLLARELRAAGLPEEKVKELTSSKNLSGARRLALNQNQTWAPVSRDMVVTKSGVTRVYRSNIIPGGSISPRFARSYAQSGLTGVSSATKADEYHARNLKVSELQRIGPNGRPETVARVIGHGVLDMWEVTDPDLRTEANKRAAKEVLEAALITNPRLKATALARAQANDPRPVKLTHVSVNLITPAGWRELPGVKSKMPDYQEQTYTKAQFEAFNAHTSAANGGQPTVFRIDDANGNEVDVRAQVDVISFSVAINPLATGTGSSVLGGWDSVYEHNRGEMIKFVGDVGEGEFGARGTKPGGFIGGIMDRLDRNDPAQRELHAQMQEQADLVRTMFTEQTFKTGNGDPTKMGRHILALHALAEKALETMAVDGEAATSSKGCKSDKDRGGVTDMEFKHLMITNEMGGNILPDEDLDAEDQDNYYVVAASSGQLENQRYNTGLGGSKEAGKLKHRIPDTVVRQYLSGLGAFAAE